MRLVAAAALVALLAAVGTVALRAGFAAPSGDTAQQIAAELRCPTCEGLSVADSPSSAATEIRRQIAEQLARGRTAEEVKAHFVERYGEWILLTPRAAAAWLLPPLAVVAALVALVAWLRTYRPRAPGGPPARTPRPARPPSARRVRGAATADRYLARVREEVEALDA